jgi:hypothetical protein
MPITLYDAFVPSCRQLLGAAQALLDKAEGWCGDRGHATDTVIGHGLAADMAPLPFQVQQMAHHSKGAIEGVRAQVFAPALVPAPADFPGLKALLAQADDFLAGLDPAELDGFVGRDMRFEFRDLRMPFTAEQFLLSFSQPNFYFHATTLYAILRNKGLPLGKRDFLGQVRVLA